MVVNGTSNVINYGTCSTAAATAAKVVSCSNFALITGAEITVKFTTTNTAANPTLNVNSTGVKAIYYRGSAISAGYLAANRTYTFRYNGSQYDLVGDLDTNTTYSAGAGLTLSGTQFKHSNSITAGTAQGDANKTLTFGGTFTIPTVTYDAQGHITGKGTTTMTMPANPNTDTRVTQTAVDASGYTNWRPLILGSSNSGTEGFNPGTTTDGVYTVQTLSCQPSSGTIRANTFKGSLSGNAATATKLATARTISLDTGVTSTAKSFDGSGNITIPVTSIKESYLSWGGKNFSGSYGCIDAAMVSDLGANRLMFGKAAGITIQYSRDGGSTWTDYGASDSDKVGLFSSGYSFNIGKAAKDTLTTNCMLRVIINTDSFGVYTVLNKFVIYLSTQGCGGCYCTIDASLESSPTIFTTFANKVPVSGWSGYNVINTQGIATYGNTPSNQYGLIRFTFGCDSVNTNYAGLSISQIMGFGGVGWTTPSNMAKTGHLYSYDSSQNAIFPAQVTAPTFRGTLSGNASSASKVNNKLTVGSKTYDGSAAVTIAASDLGLASAMLFLGTTTTAITDGATTNPITISGASKTVTAGNVVLYGSKEFVWTGSAWEELGNEGSYKIVQSAVADPSASGTSNTFIATISQDTNGKITATKKTVAVTNNTPTLSWGATSTIGSVAGTNLQVKMPANPNTDTKVTQTVTTSNATYPLLLAPNGQTATTTTTSYFDSGVTLNPSTNTIAANISGNAATATKATKDGNGNTISSTYLPLSAGESKKLTGPLGLTENVNYGTSLPSSGFTGQLFFLEDVSQDDLPIASATVSGIVTTGTQAFAGNKTFNNNVYFGANGSYGYVDSSGVHGAIWNDYAEFRNQFEQIEPGYCVASTDDGKVYKTTEKFQACDGIVSDTFGFSIGKTDECKTPLAVAGRVLAYCEGERSDYHAGDTVCAGINGLICKMTREEIKEYPDRIVGIVSEIPDYETWGSGNVPVNGRIWIKVK